MKRKAIWLNIGTILTLVLIGVAAPAHASGHARILGSGGPAGAIGGICTESGVSGITVQFIATEKKGLWEGTWNITLGSSPLQGGTITGGNLIDKSSYTLTGTVTSDQFDRFIPACSTVGRTETISGSCGAGVLIQFVTSSQGLSAQATGEVKC